MYIRKPTALDCAKRCDRFVTRVYTGVWIVHVCAECALRINSLLSCPLEAPYPDVKPIKKSKSQSKQEQKHQIAKAKMLQAVRKESYEDRITRLKKEYKK